MAYGITVNQGNIEILQSGKLMARDLKAEGEGSFGNLSVKTPRRITINLSIPVPRQGATDLKTITSEGMWDMSGNLVISAGCIGNCSGSCGGSCSDYCTGCSGCSGGCRHT